MEPKEPEGTGRPGAPERPAQARELVHDLLLTVEPPVDVLVLADAVLVASELVTNALRHGGGLTAFRVALVDDAVEVSASDRSTRPPATQREAVGGAAATSGYGWPLVQRIARTEVTPTAEGKTVRAWIALRPLPEPHELFGSIPAQRGSSGD